MTDDDEQLARTLANLEDWERRHWLALAMLAHPLEERPSRSDRIWLSERAPHDRLPRPLAIGDVGKWCIFRPTEAVDAAWEKVRASVLVGKLWSAKVSGRARTQAHLGMHVICIYCLDSGDLEAVMRVRGVVREMGFTEELGYKTDAATAAGIYGPGEWMLRE